MEKIRTFPDMSLEEQDDFWKDIENMEHKSCLGQWNDCPESTKIGICRKERKCLIEINCMQEFLRLNNKNK